MKTLEEIPIKKEVFERIFIEMVDILKIDKNIWLMWGSDKEFYFDPNVRTIVIDYSRLTKLYQENNVFDYVKYKFDNNIEKMIWGIGHELGHYFQFIKNKNWYDFKSKLMELTTEYGTNSVSDKRYRQFSQEWLADKVGIYLLKQIKRRVLDD